MSTHSYVDTLTSRRQTGSRRNLLASLDEDESAQFNRELFRAIGQYIKPYKWQSILSVVLLAIYTFANLANPFLIGLAIDNYIQRGDSMGLGVISLVLLAVNVILWQAQYWQVWTMSWVGQETLTQLSADMFEHLQELSLSFFDRTEIGRVMSRLQSDIGVLEQMLSSGVLSLLGSVIALVGIIVIMLAMNAVLALLTFAVLPLMVIIAAFWQRYSQRSFRRTRATISLVNSTLQENISGMRVIQSLAREDRSRSEFDDLNRRNLDTNLEASRIGNYILPLVEVVAAMAIALVVIFGGLQVANHSLQVGVLVAFTLYINRFFDPIRDLTQQYMQLQRSSVAIERIFQILGIEVEVRDRPDAMILPPIVGNVEFQHVVFGYEATAPVLRDFDLTINAGQTVAIVGPTGAGKSTIAGLLQRLYDVQGGAIRVDGYNVQDVTQKSLRSQIGVVLQDPFLFSGTIRDNIRFGRLNATDQEVEKAAGVVGAHELIERLPLGYETPIQERGQNLSVGQRQIISFARALLADPRVLILDEATANIDTLTELLVQQGMRRLLEGRTALVIAHRLSTIKNADVIIVLRAGRIVEKGTHAELLAVDGAYAKLYALGFRHAESAAS